MEYIELSPDDMSSVSEGPPMREPKWKEIKELHKEGDYWQIQKLIKFVKVRTCFSFKYFLIFKTLSNDVSIFIVDLNILQQ